MGERPPPRSADDRVVSAARHAHGLPVQVTTEPASASPPVVPLLVLVLGLAVATLWFVAIPLVNRPAAVERKCEVIVLKTGKTKCVPERTLESLTAGKKKPAARPKR